MFYKTSLCCCKDTELNGIKKKLMFKGKTLVDLISDQKVFNSDRDIYSWKESPVLELVSVSIFSSMGKVFKT